MTAYYLMDCWNSDESLSLWLKDESGEDQFFYDIFHPKIQIRFFTTKGRYILQDLVRNKVLIESSPLTRNSNELWTGRSIEVLCFRVANQSEMRRYIQNADFIREHIEFFGVGSNPVVEYFLEQNIFPLAKLSVERKEGERFPWGGNLLIQNLSPPVEGIQRDMPPLKIVSLACDHGRYIPIGDNNPIRLLVGEELYTLVGSEKDIVSGLNQFLSNHDPDIIFTNGGDEFIFPTLTDWSHRLGIPLLLDRDNTIAYRNKKPKNRTFYSYGRIIHKSQAFPLFGRLHIDRRESFFYSESDLEGIFEMSRFSRLPIQRLARSSPGTAMSTMEEEIAIQKNILIPRVKGKASSIKPLSTVLKVDQGGMTFRPLVGYYENVVELDFRSLYPNIMSVYNVSGETVNCKCCSWDEDYIPVPDSPYYTCKKRRGIVSDTVEILIQQRDRIKDILDDPSNILSDRDKKTLTLRSTALKWCLVTCFGYTGYKNAKFGRREAHESITAWGRYAITEAKRIAETMGYHFLHGLTDSLWLIADDPRLLEKGCIDELSQKVKDRLSLRLLLEARYSWIVFPVSKQREGFAVPTRYYARDLQGKVKFRGIALRRKNTPRIVCDFQTCLLDELALCNTSKEVKLREANFYSILSSYEDRLYNNNFTKLEIVVSQNISKHAGGYTVNSASKVVLDAILEQGIRLEGGQKIEYIVTDRSNSDPKKRYIPYHQFSLDRDRIDCKFYKELLQDAWDEVLGIFFPERDLFRTYSSNLIKTF